MTGNKLAKALLIISIIIMLVALICSFIFNTVKDSRIVLIILLCTNTAIFFSLYANDKKR